MAGVESPPWVPGGNVVVHLLASGVIEHFHAAQSRQSFRLPYPATLQMALDKLTLRCWRQGAPAPSSVIELLDWAAAPFGDWKVQLDDADVDADESLVRFGRPTTTCEELGMMCHDVEGEVRENALIRAAMDKARAARSPEAYVAFRQLLIERPATTALDLDENLNRPELAILADEVRQAYGEAPPEAIADGVVRTCARCGGLRLPQDDGRTWYCEDTTCTSARPGPEHRAAEGVWWLRRELRMFIVAPGRAELRIAKAIEREGAPVQLWPDFDAYDLSVFEVRPWVADVKAWRNPLRLARQLRSRLFEVPAHAERAYVVIAQEQIRRERDYIKRLRRECPDVRPGQRVVAISESDFVDLVKQRLADGQ